MKLCLSEEMSELVATEEELQQARRDCAHYADLAAAGAALSLWLTLWEKQGNEWLQTWEGTKRAYEEVTSLHFELSGSQGAYTAPTETSTNPPMIDGIKRLRLIAGRCEKLLDEPLAAIEAAKRLFEEKDAQTD